MKRLLVVISAILLMALALSACGGKASKAPVASGNFTTIYEQSELRWYIAEKYGQEAVSKYCFYDLDDQGEASFVVAYRYMPGDEPELLVRCFNKDLTDWFSLNNDILVSAAFEERDDVPGIGKIYGVTLYGDIDPRNEYSVGPGPYYAYITCNKDGLLERVLLQYDIESEYGTAGRYEYDNTGAVSVYYGYDFDMKISDFFNSEYNPRENWEYQYKYSYGSDGFLKDAAVEVYRYDEEPYTETAYRFTYNAEGRIKTEETTPGDDSRDYLECERDSEGRLISAGVYDSNGFQDYRITVEYESGGFCIYIPVYD